MTRNSTFWILPFFALFFLNTSTFGQIFQPEGLNMPGTWDGFANPPTVDALRNPDQSATGNLVRITTGQDRYQTTIYAANSGGDVASGTFTWLFTSGPAGNAFANKWANVAVNMNSLQNYTIGGNTDNSITLQDGFYYTMNFENVGYQNARAIFMETSAAPVDLVSVSSNATYTNAETPSITVTSSATPSAEEIVYIRYSTDNFQTSNLSLVTFNGTTGTATLPAQNAGASVDFYVFSTTVSNPTADYDLLTIKFNNNGGSNYSYNVICEADPGSITATENTVCYNTSTTINTTTSLTGADYTLKKSSDNSVVDGPITGTGAALSFNTGNISETTDFYVEGQSVNCTFTSNPITISVKPTLMISEFIANPTGTESNNEWIEIYNYGAQAIDIQDFDISDEDSDDDNIISTSYSLAAGDFVILANNKSSFESNWLGGASLEKVIEVTGITLANTSDEIQLEDASDNIIWSLAYADDDTEGNSTFLPTSVTCPTTWGSKASPGISRNTLDNVPGTPLGYQKQNLSSEPNKYTAADGDVGSPFNGTVLTSSFTITNPILCNGGTVGAVTANVFGGGGPFNYNWSTGATVATETGLSAGTYYVTISNQNNVTVIDTVEITEPAAFTVDVVEDSAITCRQDSNGVLRADVTGGTPPFSYAWSNGVIDTNKIHNLSEQFLTVTVTDSNGCTASDGGALVEPQGIQVSPSFTQVSCFGGNDGEISLTATSSTGSVTFAWSNGAGNVNTISNLTAGIYSVTMTDGDGCTEGGSVPITEPSELIVTATTDADVSATGLTDGAVSVSATGGTPPYAYLWSNSATATALTNLASGTYTVTVTDDNGCTASDATVVTQPNQLIASATVDNNVSCNGGADGSATASGSGGATPYTYLWSNGATSATASGLAANVYTVTITDANNLTDVASVTITEPANALSLSVSVDQDASTVGGNDGAATATASGGTTPYSFSWSGSTSTVNTASDLSAGTQGVTVTDANGCTANAGFTITEPQPVFTTVDDSICDTDSLQLPAGDFTSTAGTYLDTLTALNGADSVITTNLNVLPSYFTSVFDTICSNDSVLVGGNFISSAGTYPLTYTSVFGCDSIEEYTIEVLQNDTATMALEICVGDSVLIGSNYETQAGTYVLSYQNQAGCDSTIIHTLTLTGTEYAISGTTPTLDGTFDGVTAWNEAIADNAANVGWASANAQQLYVTQDGEYVYFGAAVSNQDWQSWGFAINTVSGGGTADPFGHSQLAFGHSNLPDYVIRGGFTASSYSRELVSWDGSNWNYNSIPTSNISVSNSFVEVRIPLVDLGNPESIDVQFFITGNNNQEHAVFDAVPQDEVASSWTGPLTTLDNYGPTISLAQASNELVCNQNSFTLPSGTIVNSSGSYVDTLSDVNGCDSLVLINVNISSNDTAVQQVTACQEYLWMRTNQIFTQSGMFYDTVSVPNQCDSIYVLDLTIESPDSAAAENVTACQSYTWPQNGQTYLMSGTYFDTVSTANVCDSIYILSLTIEDLRFATTQTETACGSFVWARTGELLLNSGIYYDTVTTANVCDSIYTLDLTIEPLPLALPQVEVACDSFVWNRTNEVFYAAGMYYDTAAVANGCDSVYVLDLSINQTTFGNESISRCAGDSAFIDGAYRFNSGTFTEVYTNAAGCDSIVTVTLSIEQSITTNTSETICAGDSIFLDGAFRSSNGTFTEVYTAQQGCDSTVNIALSVLAPLFSSDTVSLCSGDTLFTGNESITQAGTYVDTLQAASGCDSIHTRVVEEIQPIFTQDSLTLCSGDSVQIGGIFVTTTGTYADSLQAASSCDSIVSVFVNVLAPITGLDSVSICAGDTIVIDGVERTEAGVYTEVYQSLLGCDSTVSVYLNVLEADTSTESLSICAGDSILIGGNFVSTPGTYTEMYSNASGCDSLVLVSLSYTNSPYQFAASAPTLDGAFDGDSIWMPSLASNGSFTGWSNANAQDLYIVQDEAYVYFGAALSADSWQSWGFAINTQAGGGVSEPFGHSQINFGHSNLPDFIIRGGFTASTYNRELVSWDGTTWNYSAISASDIGVSESFVEVKIAKQDLGNPGTIEAQFFITGNNNAEHAVFDAVPADDIAQTWQGPLTILDNYASAVAVSQVNTEILCNQSSFTLPSGNVVTASGWYLDTLADASGCDSILSFDIQFGASDTTAFTTTACDSYTWPTNGIMYTQSGVYYDTLLNAQGCDSILILDLTLNQTPDTTRLNLSACEIFVWMGDTLLQAGLYYDTLQTATGCDSIVELSLNLVPKPSVSIDTTRNLWCNAISFTAIPDTGLSFYWSNGNTGAEWLVQAADGIFQTTQVVGDNGVCTSDTLTLSVNLADYTEYYNLIAGDYMLIKRANPFFGGNLGVTNTNGYARVDNFSGPKDIDGFIQADSILSRNFTLFDTLFHSAAAIDLPVHNTATVIPLNFDTVRALPNQSKNARRRHHLIVEQNATMTLNSDVYGDLWVKRGATVIINSPVVQFTNIYMEISSTLADGPEIVFNQPTLVGVRNELVLDKRAFFNPTEQDVTVYIGGGLDRKQFSFSRAAATINANVFVQGGRIEAVPGFSLRRTNLTGRFIADTAFINAIGINWFAPDCGGLAPAQQALQLENQLAEEVAPAQQQKDELPATDFGEFAQVKLYPNPSNGIITLELSGFEVPQADVFITDIAGKVLFSSNYSLCEDVCRYTLDLNELPTGMYFLQLRNEQSAIQHKISKVE